MVLSFPLAQAAVDKSKSQEYFESAVDELRAQNTNAAVIQLRNALQQDPGNLAARTKLGVVLLEQDDPLAAVKELEKAQAMGGDENLILVPLATAYMKLVKFEHIITGFVSEGHEAAVDAALKLLQAEAYMNLGAYKEAEKQFLDASTLLPADPRPLLGRAKMMLLKGRSADKASDLLEQAVGLAPDSFDVWLFKALLHRDQGDHKNAEVAFEKALEIFPSSVRTLTARAAMWLDLGEIEKAKTDLEVAAEFDRSTLETIYLQSLILFSEGKEAEARETLRRGADEIKTIRESYRAKLPDTKLMLGIVSFYEKNYEDAISQLSGYLTKFPTHGGAKRFLSSAYLATGNMDEVIKLLTPKVSDPPVRDPFLLSILAEAHRAKGDFRAAERNYTQALRAAPRIAGIGVRLASNRLDAGDPERGIKELEYLVQRFPDLLDAHIQLTRVYMTTGNTQKALTGANTLLSQFPDQADAQNMAGVVYLAAGNVNKARERFEQAILLEPTLFLPKLNLARLAKVSGNREEAMLQFRQLVEKFPSNVTAELELCQLLVDMGEFDETATRLASLMERAGATNEKVHQLNIRRALRANEDVAKIREAIYKFTSSFPEDPSVEFEAGKAYRKIGDLEDAKVLFRSAVENAQYDTDMLFRIANQQFKIADLDGAMWSLTKAKQANTNNLQVEILSASVLTQRGEFERARTLINDARAEHGDRPEIALVEGDLFMEEKDTAKAILSYERAYAAAPVRKTLLVLFNAYIDGQQYEHAASLATRWLEKNPTDYNVLNAYGELLLQTQRWEEARKVYETMQQAGIENPVILNNLASIYQRLDDPRALPAAELAYKSAPHNAAVLDTYGWILTQNGRVEEGLAILREAYARASTQPEIRYHIGKALASLGRTDAALEEVRAALEEGIGFKDKNAATELLEQLEKN